MKMKKTVIIPILASLFGMVGCSDFLDINTNPNSPTDVSTALLLGPIEVQLAGDPGFINANHLMQNIALNQVAPNVGTYQFTNTSFNNPWQTLYVNCINNIRIMHDKAIADGNTKYAGIAKILEAYSLAYLTDGYGEVPYSEAFQGIDVQFPAYDSQESIYNAIQSLLDEGIAYIAQDQGVSPGNDDFYYRGDMPKWRKLAYTLKARYYMRLTKVYGASAQANLVLTALQNAMTSNADDMSFSYPGTAGYFNRWFNAMLPVETVILGSTLVDSLVARNDPRISQLVSPAQSDGAYRGREIGIAFASLPSLQSFSVVGPSYGSADAVTYLVNYSEVLFLRAEATLILSGAAVAQPVYQEAIRSHMEKLGVDEAAVLSYLAARGTLSETNALQRIIEEKNIANYLLVENYNDWRRTGYPILSVVENAELSTMPRRYLYPQSELNNNPQPQHDAGLTDRVWWDQ